MEKIYNTTENKFKIVKTKAETVDFLLNYSKSLKFTRAEGITFESNLN